MNIIIVRDSFCCGYGGATQAESARLFLCPAGVIILFPDNKATMGTLYSCLFLCHKQEWRRVTPGTAVPTHGPSDSKYVGPKNVQLNTVFLASATSMRSVLPW